MIILPPSRALAWLLVAGVAQPVAMMAHELAPWYWADPAFARLISLSGAWALCLHLSVWPDAERTRTLQLAMIWPAVLLWAVPVFLLGLEHNWAYRLAFLGLQAQLVVLWYCAIGTRRSRTLLEFYAKRWGLVMALIGLGLCVLFQFVLAPTQFSATLAWYDPRIETVDLITLLTGQAMMAWLLPLISLTGIVLLAGWHGWRCRRRSNLVLNLNRSG